MSRKECVETLNLSIGNFQLEKLFPMILEFLIMRGIKNADKKIPYLTQIPAVLSNVINQTIDYYCIKFNIIKVYNSQNQLIAYY